MSLPPTMTRDRDALRNALRSSLSDVLFDLGVEGLGSRSVVDHTSGFSPFRPNPSVAVGGNAFDAPFLASRQEALVSQSLGVSASSLAALRQTQAKLATSQLGLSADSILLAAAAASERSKLLEQAKATLLQQQIAEESKRLLLQRSYLELIQKGLAASKNDTILPALPQPKANAPSIPGEKALEALGCSLRSKTDPYIDVSEMPDPDPDDSALRRTRGGVSEPFPEKLHRMLEDIEKEGKSDIVSFYSHGRAFGVHDMDRFVKEIMPKYFKQSKWNSFARQLNLYGFIRITSGPDAGGYYHELFLKGRPNLCLHMRRVGVPQGEDRRKFRPKNKNVEPDFYSMKHV